MFSPIQGPKYEIQLLLLFGGATDATRKLSWIEQVIIRAKERASALASRVKEENDLKGFEESLRRILANPYEDYETRRCLLEQLSDISRSVIAAALEPSLNKYAATVPHETYDEKKELAKWINAELRRFGLAIKSPDTGSPCLIVATTGRNPAVGRFVLDYTDEFGKRHHPLSSGTLPHLEVMLDDLTRAPYGQNKNRSR